MSNMRFAGSGNIRIDKEIMYSEKIKHEKLVGLLFDQETVKSCSDYCSI